LLACSQLQAKELWDFIWVGQDHKEGPKWVARDGKAEVVFRGTHVTIYATYSDWNSTLDPSSDPSIVIDGELGPNSRIRATCSFPGTDRNPVKLTGQYTTRSDIEFHGPNKKVVTHKEIVFPHPPNFEHMGFLSKDVRDAQN
jgi:hypothetical protein